MEANKTKINKPEQKEEVLISVARIKRAKGLEEKYQYDIGVIHHTIHSLDNVETI